MKKKNLALGIFGGTLGGLVAWKMLTRADAVDWNDVSERVTHSENSHFVEIDGATVHYQEFGAASSPTLILIHGYTSSTYVWHAVAPAFAEQGFRVVAVDLLGFGYSDKPASFDYSIASQARVVSRFMNRLGIGRATVVGNSYGGAVAATLALDYAERVEKLVLVDAVINNEATKSTILKLASIPLVGEVLSPFLLDSKRFFKRRMRGTIAPENHHLITPERIESVWRPLHAADAHRSVLATARAWNADRIERDAQLITHPTLIVWGDSDRVTPIRSGEKLHESILNSRFVVFKNCGHIPQEEASENFVKVVGKFCRSRKGNLDVAENDEMRVVNG